MRKNFLVRLFLSAMLFAPIGANAQVTIGSNATPQATLDIIGNPSETGRAFRLIDGNQFPGRILTAGENGIGTWQNNNLTIFQSTTPQPATPKSVLISDYPTPTIFVDYDFYIDLAPGRYMILAFVPVSFNFNIEMFENITFSPLLTRDGISVAGGVSVFVNGPVRANVLIRQLTVFTLTVPPSDTLTRYYVGYHFAHFNSDGINITTNTTLNPNTATNRASFIRSGVGGFVYAIPMQ